MMLLNPEQRELLLANGRLSRQREDFDPHPVAKLFTPDAGATWLITELDPDDPSIAFGLCDLGLGSPELGSVSLDEITAAKDPLGLAVERELHFVASQPISAYAEAARRAGRIIA